MTKRDRGAVQHVVIIGGGFGGLNVARSLKSAPVKVTLIDCRNFHLFQPLLYSTASCKPLRQPNLEGLKKRKSTDGLHFLWWAAGPQVSNWLAPSVNLPSIL